MARTVENRRRGLIAQPSRPERAGYRVCSAETARRIRFIRQAQRIGFSLREIGELLSLRADPSADCGEVRERQKQEPERRAASAAG